MVPRSVAPKVPDEDDDLSLPPIDDDGAIDEGEVEAHELVPDRDEEGGLDDATMEGDPIDAWVEVPSISSVEESAGLDDAPADITVDAAEILAGAEQGLLEGSDEGDGRDASADESGVLDEDARSDDDDGGAEGTGEDPAASVSTETNGEPLSLDHNVDDDALDDEALEDPSAARLRAGLEREPWPPRADVAWVVTKLDDDVVVQNLPSPTVTLGGKLLPAEVLASRAGAFVGAVLGDRGLLVSIDGGATSQRVAGCSTATALCALPVAASGVVLVVGLHDASRDVAGVAIVRVGLDGPAAEVIAELPRISTEDGDASVEAIVVRVAGGRLEIDVRGGGGAFRIRTR